MEPYKAKQCIRYKLIDFQKKIAHLSFDIASLRREQSEGEKELYFELFEIVDSFENIYQTIENKESEWEKSVQRVMKSYRSIYKKIVRLLSERGVVEIEFPENKAIIGLCKVVDTRSDPEMENEKIITILRKGYKKESGEVIRPAEVITVLNK